MTDESEEILHIAKTYHLDMGSADRVKSLSDDTGIETDDAVMLSEEFF